MKLYIVANNKKIAPTGTENIDGIYFLISEQGECFYEHWCSNRGYAKGDLVLRRPERIKELEDKFGMYELIHLGEDEMTLDVLIQKNKEFYKVGS